MVMVMDMMIAMMRNFQEKCDIGYQEVDWRKVYDICDGTHEKYCLLGC